MASNEIRKYRCRECGEICWTIKSKGCRKCHSASLELFVEPSGYKEYRSLIHTLSSDLATLAKKSDANVIEEIALKYAEVLSQNTANLSIGSHHCKEFYKAICELLNRWTKMDVQSVQIISEFLTLWQEAINYDRYISELIHKEISNWIRSLSGQIPIEERGAKLRITIRNEEPFPGLLLNDKASRLLARQVLTRRDYGVISGTFSEFIEESGGSVTRESVAKPGVAYARLPFNYHINLTEAAWTLLQNSVKIVPIIVLLARLEVPHYAETVGAIEAVRTVVTHVNKIREEKGEACVYRAIGSAKKRLGTYPSLEEIKAEMEWLECSFQQCKFFQPSSKIATDKRDNCSIDMSDLEVIVSFLKDKGIVKQMAADEWWISF